MKFIGDHEKELQDREFGEMFLSTDRQSYLTNWNLNKDARNVQITGIGTADQRSGYVLAMNIDYDPAPDPLVTEAEAISLGDYNVAPPYRRHARLWLEGDFAKSADRAAAKLKKRKERRQ